MAKMTDPIGACCQALLSILPQKVAFPGSLLYNVSLNSYFSAQQAELVPCCIVTPADSQDVSSIMTMLNSMVPKAPDCQFALRSGGASTVVGSSNIAGGVTIDLGGFNNISLSEDHLSATIGVGASWGDVYAHLDPLNMSVAGARAAEVGVGGLLLGGGISYFAPRYGWACDNIVDMEVVLANGSIVHANTRDEPSLLWAACGGGSNFGIVTQVKLNTFDQGNFWGGVVYHDSSYEDDELKALAAFSSADTYDEYSSLVSTFAFIGATQTFSILNNMEYTKPVATPEAFLPFMNIPALQSTERITNMSNLAFETASLQTIGLRELMATVTIIPTLEALNATVQEWKGSLAKVQDVFGIVWSLVLEPIPPSIYARYSEDNALGLTERHDKSLLIVMLSATWSDSADDVRVNEAAQALVGAIGNAVGDLDALDPFIYLNYAASWQSPIGSYGLRSVESLTSVQQAYDPKRIFTHYFPGGFKIPVK